MASVALLFLLLVGYLSTGTHGANILYINTVASPSHFGWNRALMYELAARGHNLTVFGVDSEPNPPPNVTFILMENVYETLYSDPNMHTDFLEMSKIGPFGMQLLFDEFISGVCDIVLQTEGAKRLYSYPADFGFDLLIHDYLSGPCLAALAHHRFGQPPTVAVTAYHGASTSVTMTGSYQYSALVPNHAYDATEDMSYKQRFINLLVNLEEELLQWYSLIPKSNRILRKIDPTLPDVAEFNAQTKLVLLNANPIIQYTEPFMPNVIPVGGLQIIKPKPLPADLAKLLEGAGPGGVVLFSLGTNVRSDSLGEARIRAIIGAMETLPEYTFLWKFETETLPRQLPANVHVRKWLPQNDLLAQPAVRLFITHSGLLSTQEAIWHGVPVIGFPVFADQFKNINYCVARGVGKRLSIEHLKQEELVAAIREIMTTESYRTNMKRMSSLFRDQPEHPLDRAVWWIEWVLRHPDATEMLTHGTRLHWFVKYSYDVLIPLFASIALVCHGLFFITRRLFCRRNATRKSQKHKRS